MTKKLTFWSRFPIWPPIHLGSISHRYWVQTQEILHYAIVNGHRQCENFQIQSVFLQISSNLIWSIFNLLYPTWNELVRLLCLELTWPLLWPSRSQWSSAGVPGCSVRDRRQCAYHDNYCDTQSWARAAAPFLQCLGRLSLLPSVGR